MMQVKQALYKKCVDYVTDRLAIAQNAIQEYQKAANEETKSSAGDKYETGRAMLQLEIEKMSAQLAEGMKLKHSLSLINPEVQNEKGSTGSLIETTSGIFYIAISLGQVKIEENNYFVVSPSSPIGSKLLGLTKGDSFSFNNKEVKILNVV